MIYPAPTLPARVPLNRAPLVLALLFLLGCSSSRPRDADFEDVQRTAEQSGHNIHWNRGTAADREVAQKVQQLLAQELTVDRAVQIALLNSPELQAEFEELGVAQADLVEAGLLRNPIFDASVRWADAGGPNVELGITQSFLDLLFIPARKRVATAQLEAAKARVADAVLRH